MQMAQKLIPENANKTVITNPPSSQNGSVSEPDLSVTLPEEAAKKYKFLSNHKVKTIMNLKENEGFAETWPSADPGDPTWPRPDSIPMGTNGIEIKRKDFRPDDWAAEVFSHIDPKGVEYSNKLLKSMSDKQMDNLRKESKDYAFSKKLGMSEDAALGTAGMAAVRAWIFGQWSQQRIDNLELNDDQKKMLDEAKNYAVNGGK